MLISRVYLTIYSLKSIVIEISRCRTLRSWQVLEVLEYYSSTTRVLKIAPEYSSTRETLYLANTGAPYLTNLWQYAPGPRHII